MCYKTFIFGRITILTETYTNIQRGKQSRLCIKKKKKKNQRELL